MICVAFGDSVTDAIKYSTLSALGFDTSDE